MTPLAANPRVTVITMVKDREWCIENCVKSVLAQDYENIEYIIQDGGSKDGTVRCVEKYGPRVVVRSEADRGPMDAFHKALGIATGDVFAILLSDERFADPHVVTRAVDALRRHPESGAIYGDFRIIDRSYKELRIARKRQLSFEEIFAQEDFISPCAAFVRMDALRDGARVRSDLRRYFDAIGDYGLWVFIGSHYPMTYVPGVMADFMIHPDEVSHNLAHCLAYIRECEAAIEAFETGMNDSDIAKLKRRALANLYLNYGNALSGKYFRKPLELAFRALRLRPRLFFTRTFAALVLKSAGVHHLLPVRENGKRMKASP